MPSKPTIVMRGESPESRSRWTDSLGCTPQTLTRDATSRRAISLISSSVYGNSNVVSPSVHPPPEVSDVVKKMTVDESSQYFIDRFGRDIAIHPSKKKGWSETAVDVAVSDQFFGWIFALGTSVKIVGPKEVVKRFKAELKERSRIYE